MFKNKLMQRNDEDQCVQSSRLKTIVVGFFAAMIFIFSMVSKNYAIWMVENPAYVSVFAMLAPFWLILIYKFMGRKEAADVKSGVILVLGCILLVICTKFL